MAGLDPWVPRLGQRVQDSQFIRVGREKGKPTMFRFLIRSSSRVDGYECSLVGLFICSNVVWQDMAFAVYCNTCVILLSSALAYARFLPPPDWIVQ